MTRVSLVALLVIAACVPSPEDPIDFGTLCAPATDLCPSFTLLERDVSGRNQVDYAIRNVGSSLAVVEIVALVPAAEFSPIGTIDPDELIARREHEPLAAGELDDNRFTAQDLGVRESLQLGIRCSGCEVELDWVFATVPRDCFEEDDCPAGWLCDENLGRCSECLTNTDCNDDQRCDLQTGRCDPPDTTASCSTGGSSPLSGPIVLLLLLFLLRRRPRRRAAASAAAFVVGTVITSAAAASPPRASISVAAGARVITGSLGSVTRRGVGLSVGQELRWRYIGAALSLGTSYFLTSQEPPPFSHSLQTYGATIGPRIYLPVWRLEFTLGPDYRRLGTANNSLIRLTGSRTSYNATGGSGGVRLRWAGLEVRLEGGAHYLFGLESTMLFADVALGFTNTK